MGVERVWWMVSLGVLVVAGCVQPEQRDPEPQTTQQTVTSEGGTVELSGTVSLEFPEGAVSEKTDVEITRTNEPAPKEYEAATDLVEFGPDGATFEEPVVVRFQHDGTSDGRTIYWSSPEQDGFEAIGTVEEDGETLQANIMHFSQGFVGARSSCRTDADCGSSQVCKKGGCVGPSCYDGTQNGNETDIDCGGPGCADCQVGKSCSADSDCASTSCVGGTCRRECMADADCGSGDVCMEGACQSPPGCRTDADCATGEVCRSGSCTQKQQSTDTWSGDADYTDTSGCTTDDDCASGEYCARGRCTTRTVDVGVGQCRTNADCSTGEVCTNGTCSDSTTDAGDPDLGRTDADCASGEVCVNGSCTADVSDGGTDDTDTTDASDTPDTSDTSDTSDTDGGDVKSCRSDSECASNQSCINGICQ